MGAMMTATAMMQTDVVACGMCIQLMPANFEHLLQASLLPGRYGDCMSGPIVDV